MFKWNEKTELNWERIEGYSQGTGTFRLKVFEGWLVYREIPDDIGITFVPDKNHE